MWIITAPNLPQTRAEAVPPRSLLSELQRMWLENLSQKLLCPWAALASVLHLCAHPDSALPSRSVPSLEHCSMPPCLGVEYSYLISLAHNSHISKGKKKCFSFFPVFLARHGQTISCIIFVQFQAPGIAGTASVQLHVVILHLMPWKPAPQSPGADTRSSLSFCL